MHEVRVYNALGKLKKVISLKELEKRSDKVLSDHLQHPNTSL